MAYILGGFIVFCLCFKFYLTPNSQLSKIPSALNATKILYQNEDYSGAGIIVYELPKETRLRVEAEGLDYLNLASNKNNKPHDDDGIFKNWSFTPIRINDAWTGPKMSGEPESKIDTPKISEYLSRYGVGVRVEHRIESQIDSIIKSPGSFFAYQNVRLIVVSPSENIIVYAYSR